VGDGAEELSRSHLLAKPTISAQASIHRATLPWPVANICGRPQAHAGSWVSDVTCSSTRVATSLRTRKSLWLVLR
jgi:hypothetical protein